MTHPADQFVRQATALAARGDLPGAARLYEQAAGSNRRTGRREDEARCLTLLATTQRLAGNLDAAAAAVARARRLPDPAGATAAEDAEVRVALGHLDAAVACLTDALRAGANPAVVLRRRAVLYTGLGRAPEAYQDFAAAVERLVSDGEQAAARRVLVERATAMHNLGDGTLFARALDEARKALADDRALAGELDLLEGAAAVQAGRLRDAEDSARSAREHALAAVQPITYVGACVALSELVDARGDRVGAYEALAVGWATLSDLVGRDAAAEVFRPRMEALEQRWGVEAFAGTRQSYEDGRRRATA